MAVKFSLSNSKMNHLSRVLGLRKAEVVSFDLPAGFTCPAADICLTFANRQTGKMIKRGKVTCYASKTEAYAPAARRLRWHNYATLRAAGTPERMADLLEEGLNKAKIVRIHSSGDFFSPEYFQAWVILAERRSDITFFGYTKVVAYAIADKPDNFYLQYSHGGLEDSIVPAGTPTCYIGEYPDQYGQVQVVCGSHDAGHEDYFAILRRESFVIPVH